MKIFTVEEYRSMILPHLSDSGAFLRISRGCGLFVSDVPKRLGDPKRIAESLSGNFDISISEGLMYFTPLFSFGANEVSDRILEILKSDPSRREKLIRQSLAEAMREKNASLSEIFESMLKEELNKC